MKERMKKLLSDKTFRIIVVCVCALLLLFAVWRVFFRNEESPTASSYQATAQEIRLAGLLSEIDGVGKTTVMIGEEDGAPVSAIVVFEGEDAILTRMRVIEAAAAALHIPPTEITVYPSASN